MRIAVSPDVIQPYVRPVPPVNVEPLPADVSEKLISSGVFAHDPNTTVWAAPGAALPGTNATGLASNHVVLPGGIRLQPHLAPPAANSPLAALLDAAEQAGPILDQCAPDGVADSVAVIASSPAIVRALAGPDRASPENLLLYGTNAVKALSAVNSFIHVPYADGALTGLAIVFKVGDQVLIARNERATDV